MAKPKQKQKTNDNNDDDNNSSKGIKWDPQFDDNWVMVKKQKITILIPPLPVTEQIAIPNPEESNPQTILPTKRAKQKSKPKSTPLTTTSVQQVPISNPNPIPIPEESNPQTILPENTKKTQTTNPVVENKKSKLTPLIATSVQQVPTLKPNLVPNQEESNPQTVLPENTTKTRKTNPGLENKKSKSTPLIATSVQQVLNPKPSLVPNQEANQEESNPQTVLPENTTKTRKTNPVVENKKSKSTPLIATGVQEVLIPKHGLVPDQEENNPQIVLPEYTTKPQKVVNPAPQNEKSKSITSVQQVPNLKPNQNPNLDVTILRTKNVRRRICCQYRDIMVNNSMRAMNVERKLRRAGGLKRWLLSMGLDEIQRILQGKCVGKFQLVNLTMKKLKDMGVAAVGPRRKLIHALDCICQPGCFEVVCE